MATPPDDSTLLGRLLLGYVCQPTPARLMCRPITAQWQRPDFTGKVPPDIRPDSYELLRQRSKDIPLPPSYKCQQTSSQSQCPILTTLPSEIRRPIWIECLGGLTAPLTFSDPCHDHTLAFNYMLVCGYLQDRDLPEKTRTGRSLLPILQTCQQIYSEAIDILYSHNKFRLSPDRICVTHELLRLPKLVISPHLNAIRCLSFTLQLERTCPIIDDELSGDNRDELERPWVWQWRILACMERLREFHVQMAVEREVWIRKHISLLEPLKFVTKPDVFVLTLPFEDAVENESFLQELPCQIRRPAQKA